MISSSVFHTTAPTLHILVKLVAIVALVIAPFLAHG